MAIRVTGSSYANEFQQQANRLNAQQVSLQQQLASQQSVERASDGRIEYRRAKEARTEQDMLEAYRGNAQRAEVIMDVSNVQLDYLRELSTEAIKTSDLLHVSIQDAQQMAGKVDIIDHIIEQSLVAMNEQYEGEYLFAGGFANDAPFAVTRDDDGFVTTEAVLAKDTATEADPVLIEGLTYEILDATGVDFTTAGASTGAAGETFVYNGGAITWPAAGGTAAVRPVQPAIDAGTQDLLIEGRAYEILSVGTSSVFTQSGAQNSAVGTQFIYNGTLPAWDGATVAPLQVDVSEEIDTDTLVSGQLYQITDAVPSGSVLPNLVEGDTPQAGTFYRIAQTGQNTDLTGTGAGLSPWETGDVFLSNGTAPTTWDGLQLTPLTIQTNGISIDDTTTGGITAGTAYVVTTAGDYSALFGASASAAGAGTILVASTGGTLAAGLSVEAAVGEQSEGTLEVGGSYFIAAGTDADFTTSGAGSNAVGTIFTATDEDAVDFGADGVVYKLQPARTQASDFVALGAANNAIGTVFTYNGTTPQFQNANGAGGTALAYERAGTAAGYTGGGNTREFAVAGGLTLAPYTNSLENRALSDFVNNLVELRDAYDLAANTTPDDTVTQEIARERAEDAANALHDSDTAIVSILTDNALKQLRLDTAEARDNQRYEDLAKRIDTNIGIDEAEVITELNNSFNAYQAALQSSAIILSQSILDYI